MNDEQNGTEVVQGVQVQGTLRGEFAFFPPRGHIFLLHDFIADDGTEFDIQTTVTSTAAWAKPRPRTSPPSPTPENGHG